MNLSQQKRERLLNFIEELKSNNSFDEKSLIELNEIENELIGKKYGLVWEEHEEAVDVQMKETVPVFAEDKSKEIVSDKDIHYNFLLEGDNLHSLYLLEKTHKGKIDVIYIDPPYNTGKKSDVDGGFIFDDAFIKDEDGYRHSKYLSFMYRRLDVAFRLLSKTGVVFINIDENESDNLMLLCKSIFGDNNVDSIIWQKQDPKVDRNTNAKVIRRFKSIHETIIICYKDKGKSIFNKMYKLPDWSKEQKNVDNDPRGNWQSGIVSFEEGHEKENKQSEFYFTISSPSGVQWTRHWFFNKIEMEHLINDNRIYFGQPPEYKNVPRLKTFENEEKEYYMDSILRGVGTSSSAKDEILSIFGDREKFDTPKPIKLVKECIRVASKRNSLVLDFFAGSGTTGHAVLELNQEDGGNRKFILCTNNENNICEKITHQRLKTVITGKREDGSKYSDGIPANFKYFKTDFVSKKSKNLSKELTKHVKELIELEWGVSIDKKVNLMVMTEDELDKIEANWDKLKTTVKSIYRVRQVVYTGKQKQLFKNINNFIIPDYYFDNELKEVGENW